jgi:hypothetical protein
MRHNTKVEEIDDSIGIVYKSNLKSYYTDLNPSLILNILQNNINIKSNYERTYRWIWYG